MEAQHSISNWIGNIVSGGAIAATLLGWLPTIAAAVGAIWYLIQIYESSTVQRFLASRRSRKIARLRDRIAALEARRATDDQQEAD